MLLKAVACATRFVIASKARHSPRASVIADHVGARAVHQPSPGVVFRSGDFAFVTGQPSVFRSSPPVLRTFCGKCGTPLTYQHDDSLNTIDVTTSTLDLPEGFAPTREIWLEHKLPWQALNEALQHFPRGSTEE